MLIKYLTLFAMLTPLLGSALAGLFCLRIKDCTAHRVTILGIALSLFASLDLLRLIVIEHMPAQNFDLYVWAISGNFNFKVGFLIDQLTVMMMVVVNTVSLLVHIYSIAYMKGDSGYARFFSYMSLFTFAMLMLVTANNFTQLFFGWEGVGLVSYLLISFWFKKDSAARGGLKAFIVNRVGDFGFILALALILSYCGSLDYTVLFAQLPSLSQQSISLWPGMECSVITLIALLVFVGAMAKSAQIPLHIWLPESMEGPTPISALIHAATMVTAGVYLVARLSPMFELSTVALNVVLVIGATGALFLGLLALVENDIKRVIAYSTMSQLGYMMAANGASGYSAAIFHLFTHAFFKALLFLAAGSIILSLHHEQDLRKMGGLIKRLPITYVTFLIGALALAAIPPFSGFYSKDAIIELVHASHLATAPYAYFCLMMGAFVTAFYIFRAFFMAFHGQPRFDLQTQASVHEPAWPVLMPLVLLAIPSVVLGFWLASDLVYSNPEQNLFGQSLDLLANNTVITQLSAEYHSALAAALEAPFNPSFWMSLAGIAMAVLAYLVFPRLPAWFAQHFKYCREILVNQYGFDRFNDWVFVRGVKTLSEFLYHVTDVDLIDGFLVNGSGRLVQRIANFAKRMQSGLLNQYVLAMILALVVLLGWQLLY
ncbi:MAG TPA: NADH-quinone oxidoreductase subunit L [Coxiellaceae bacterium]|nr:NADH-quinone oxidoreductase subunit L [Coxiellaceae bacterium]